MANLASFDITSGVDLQEVDNAVNQARKEVAQRYDFKGSRAAIDLNRVDNTLTLTADDEFKMNALWEIVQTRMVRRGVPTKNLTPGAIERAANDTVRRTLDRKSTRLNSSHLVISYAVFCLKKKKTNTKYIAYMSYAYVDMTAVQRRP